MCAVRFYHSRCASVLQTGGKDAVKADCDPMAGTALMTAVVAALRKPILNRPNDNSGRGVR
jgi:hypothetical protein